jgi:hypothetical protein
MCHKATVDLAIRLNSNSPKFHLLCKNVNVSSYDVNNQIQVRVSRKFSGLVSHQSLYKDNNNHQIASSFFSNSIGIKFRSYSSQKEHEVPKIMEFPQVIWPSVFKSIRNWILSNFIIMRYFDSDFNLPDFVNGSKQVREIIRT